LTQLSLILQFLAGSFLQLVSETDKYARIVINMA
jgi:hypothetical protein